MKKTMDDLMFFLKFDWNLSILVLLIKMNFGKKWRIRFFIKEPFSVRIWQSLEMTIPKFLHFTILGKASDPKQSPKKKFSQFLMFSP